MEVLTTASHCIQGNLKVTNIPSPTSQQKLRCNLRKPANGSKAPPKRPPKSSRLQPPGFRPSARPATSFTTRGPTSSPSTTLFPTSKEKRATRLLLLLRPIAAWRQHRPCFQATNTVRITSFTRINQESVPIKGITGNTKLTGLHKAAPVWVQVRP